jgi:hypothetical protein
MKIKILLCFMLLLSLMAIDFDLETGLIGEFSGTTKECVKKLQNILKVLPADDQYALNSALGGELGRCFDPVTYNKIVADKLKSMNKAFATNVGKTTNKLVTSFGCIEQVAKDNLNQEYYDYVSNYLTSLTPYGSYPMFTRCLATFIQNVNYVLRTRFRYFLTMTSAWDAVGIFNSDGTLKGFNWKTSERDVLVNEWSRLEMCVNQFENSVLDLWEYLKLYFANSKECGVTPGKYQEKLFGTMPVDSGVGTGATGAGGTVEVQMGKIDPVPPTASSKPADSGTNTTTVATAPPSGTGTAQPAKSETIDPNPGVDSNTNAKLVTNPNANYDPCFDWSTYVPPRTDAGAGGAAVAATSVSSGHVSSGSSPSPSPDLNVSAKMAMPIYSDDYYKSLLENKVFCPNLIGKDLNKWEAYTYSYIQLKDILNSMQSILVYVEEVYQCLSTQNPNLEILKYIKDITSYQDGYVNKNLLNDLSNEISSTTPGFEKNIISLDYFIKKNGINGLKDFNVVCSQQVCKCEGCPTPFKFSFNYSMFDYYDTLSSTDPNYDAMIKYKPQPPKLFNAYISKCNDKVIYFLINQNEYSSQPVIDIKILSSTFPELTSIAETYYLNLHVSMVQNLQNVTQGWDKNPFVDINATCKKSFSKKCFNLSMNISKLSPERTGVKECDITKVDLTNHEDYEKFKNTCMKWIDSNLIDGSVALNQGAMNTLISTISRGYTVKALRFLQNLNTSFKVVDGDAVDTDKQSDISGQASKGSYGTLDVDGSSYLNFFPMVAETMGGPTMKTAAPMAASAAGGSVSTDASATSGNYAANAHSLPRDVGPPRLSSSSHVMLSWLEIIMMLMLLF